MVEHGAVLREGAFRSLVQPVLVSTTITVVLAFCLFRALADSPLGVDLHGGDGGLGAGVAISLLASIAARRSRERTRLLRGRERLRQQARQGDDDTAVDFGAFTVRLGPTNSGKSAFLRGVRACLRNTSVPVNVRQGTSKALTTARFEDGAVEIERGKRLSTYGLTRDTYTKSGRTVPDDVAVFIALAPVGGLDATSAFQLDKPFLLAEPGSQVTAALGSLTNVSMLHDAVRETNRRRGEGPPAQDPRRRHRARLSARTMT